MWLKFGVAKLLCIYIGLTKFEENPEGLSFFCVDLTWNDPNASTKPFCLKYTASDAILKLKTLLEKPDTWNIGLSGYQKSLDN